MFETLVSKTFFILGSQLCITWIAMESVIALVQSFSHCNMPGMTQIEAKKKSGVVGGWHLVKPYFFLFLLIDFLFFFIYWFAKTQNTEITIQICLFAFASIFTGVLLALAFVSIDKDIAGKIVALVANITIITAAFGIAYAKKFGIMRLCIAGALILLLAANVFRVLISISSQKKRLNIVLLVCIFTFYLLFDFHRLSQMQKYLDLDSWDVAMDIAMEIYLDIIQFLLELLKALGSDEESKE